MRKVLPLQKIKLHGVSQSQGFLAREMLLQCLILSPQPLLVDLLQRSRCFCICLVRQIPPSPGLCNSPGLWADSGLSFQPQNLFDILTRARIACIWMLSPFLTQNSWALFILACRGFSKCFMELKKKAEK